MRQTLLFFMHVMVHDVILGKVNGNRKQGRRRAMLMKRWCEGEEGSPHRVYRAERNGWKNMDNGYLCGTGITLYSPFVLVVVFPFLSSLSVSNVSIIFGNCCNLRGVAGRDSGFFFLMNFELFTFPCRELIKLSIHI